jgi:hypothetical protein
VQAQRDADFERRMFTYHYRIHDRFVKKDEAHQVVSFAVLADAAAHWRPDCFGYSLWGFSLQMNFPSVKLLDWRGREAELEAASNPFAAIVLAHLQAVATKNDPRTRFNVTLSYCKALFRKGYSSQERAIILRVTDWLMDMPVELKKQLRYELKKIQEGDSMPYISSFEQFAKEEGLVQGLLKGEQQGLLKGRAKGRLEGQINALTVILKARFGEFAPEFAERLNEATEADLQRWLTRAVSAESVADIFI